jgi:hypothetical protein
MREVVKKEVIKLLDASGIIYPVPHSEWVRLVHCGCGKPLYVLDRYLLEVIVTIRSVVHLCSLQFGKRSHFRTVIRCPKYHFDFLIL